MNQDAGRRSDRSSAPRWFFLIHLWTTLPILGVIVGIGYASHHTIAGVIVAAAYLVIGVGFGRWSRSNRARIRQRVTKDPEYKKRYTERSDRFARIFGWLFASLGLVMVIIVVVWVVARLV